MKTLSFFFLLALAFGACVQNEKPTNDTATALDLYDQINLPEIKYDSVFAAKLGSDEYGMKQYVMAYLKRGPNRSQDSVTAANLQKAHLENIIRMANEGTLVLAGPFMDDGEVRGIYVFDVKTVEEARALTETDPAIKAGRLAMELHPWYGPAALPLITPLSKRLEKKSVAE
jgi:uncharacterized protein YciI